MKKEQFSGVDKRCAGKSYHLRSTGEKQGAGSGKFFRKKLFDKQIDKGNRQNVKDAGYGGNRLFRGNTDESENP